MLPIAFTLVLLASTVATAAPRLDKHSGGVPCGLPRFAERLSVEKKEQLKDIWEDYQPGEPCEAEKERTRLFVKGLSEDERATAFAHAAGGHHGPQRGGGPSFLEGVSEEVKAQFTALFHDNSLTRDEKHAKFHDLAHRVLTGKNLEDFTRFEQEMEKKQTEWNSKVDSLSPEARAVYDQLQELREQRRKAFAAAAPEVRAELDKLFASSLHNGPNRHHHRRIRRSRA